MYYLFQYRSYPIGKSIPKMSVESLLCKCVNQCGKFDVVLATLCHTQVVNFYPKPRLRKLSN